jgi:hypothetical protein
MVLRNAMALELGPMRWVLVVLFPVASLVPLLFGSGEPALDLAQAIAIGVATPVVLEYIARQELVIDEKGIRYRTALPGPLAALSPSWTLPWSELRAVRWGEGLARHELVLSGARGRLRLNAAAFHASRETVHAWRRRATGALALPVVAALRERGVDVPHCPRA